MSRLRARLPDTALVSAMAALTTWLTLLAWSPFHERPASYLVPLLGACLMVAAVGTALRALRTPALLVAPAQLLVLGLWWHHSWAAGGALDGWLPTAESLSQLRAVLAAGVDASQTTAAPLGKDVTAFAPLMILVGSLVAVVVDLIAAGLRRAPVAGLPLLAVYTAPVSILDGGVSWLKFMLAGLAFLFLVAAQEEGRLARWGQQVGTGGRVFDTQDTRVSHRAVWGSARKIGLTATGLAVVVPLVVPTLSLGLLDGPGPGSGPGGDSVTVDNPLVNMKRDLDRGVDVDMVRVRTDDPDTKYLRTTVLDVYTGDAWVPSNRDIPPEQRVDGLVPRPPGLEDTGGLASYRWEVELLPGFRSKWLPAPYPVSSVDVEQDFRYDPDTMDFVVGDPDAWATELGYGLERLDVRPQAADMAFAGPAPAAVFGPSTDLPDEVAETVRDLAETVASGARSKYEAAVALQRWFRVDGGFSYSLDPAPGNGVDDLERFLADTPDGREGYCEQFASAMALMGRALAIPSRVAVGFLRGDVQDDGSVVYSAHDMHAWPEMYFEGTGWVRFEPTPGGRTGAVPDYTTDQVPDQQPSASASASSAAPTGPNRIDRTVDPADAGAAGTGGGPGATGIMLTLAAGLLLGALALLPRAARAGLRRRRWEQADTTGALAEVAWAELRDSAIDLGAGWDDRVTVRQRARDLVRGFAAPGGDAGEDALGRPAARGSGVDPEAEQALVRVVEVVEVARYARTSPVAQPLAEQVAAVQADVDRVRASLEAGAGRRRRTRAQWLPSSLWVALRRRVRSAGHSHIVLTEPGVDRAV